MNLFAANYDTDARHLLHEIRCQDRLAEVFAAVQLDLRRQLLDAAPHFAHRQKLADDARACHADVVLRHAKCLRTCGAHCASVVLALLPRARVGVAAVHDHRLQLAAVGDAFLRHAQRCRLERIQRVHACR
ncbi:hypothetical protein D3C84_774740 [compost metagenome]